MNIRRFLFAGIKSKSGINSRGLFLWTCPVSELRQTKPRMPL